MSPTGALLKVQSKLLKATGGSLRSRIAAQGRRVSTALRKERDTSQELHGQVQAVLRHISLVDPGLGKRLEKAYAYAVFPSVGRASALLGASYGKGEVYRKGRLVGYGGVVQLTLGVQVGGQTYTEILVFKSRSEFDYFKQGKMAFAANAAALMVKAGGAATNDVHGIEVRLFSRGGFQLDVSLGGQKFVFRPAALSRFKKVDHEPHPS
jgi:lipid-binding SYLF domain-containing protein